MSAFITRSKVEGGSLIRRLGAGRFRSFTRRMWESSLVHYKRHLIRFISIIDLFFFFFTMFVFRFSFLLDYSSRFRQSARSKVSIGKGVWGKQRFWVTIRSKVTHKKQWQPGASSKGRGEVVRPMNIMSSAKRRRTSLCKAWRLLPGRNKTHIWL